MAKRTAPAALRTREPIAAALDEILPERGTVLELGSGTGEHAVFLARRFPALEWQPSDPDPLARASIEAWAAEARLPNLRSPLDLELLVQPRRAHDLEPLLDQDPAEPTRHERVDPHPERGRMAAGRLGQVPGEGRHGHLAERVDLVGVDGEARAERLHCGPFRITMTGPAWMAGPGARPAP